SDPSRQQLSACRLLPAWGKTCEPESHSRGFGVCRDHLQTATCRLSAVCRERGSILEYSTGSAQRGSCPNQIYDPRCRIESQIGYVLLTQGSLAPSSPQLQR